MCCTRPSDVSVGKPFDISQYVVIKTLVQEIHSFANQFGFARDSPRIQLNLPFVMFPGNWMCCTRPPHVPAATIFEISRYVYIRNALLIRLHYV
ncbi:hypothetical protein CSKR_111837 [Clonorchis sinensis]|uniref:Uncharacterized protein n=1 Tax=Clonorchis sinensis TaxID=79923 RepID=A0A419QE02_CLOSI|nr:hypothetical protein CSKR_111837 [Clonorchis sinensis]